MSLLDEIDFKVSNELEEGGDVLEDLSYDETEELLDNLGYINFYKDRNKPPEISEIFMGLKKFRKELAISCIKDKPLISPKLVNGSESVTTIEASEEELDFLTSLSSLENEFSLQSYTLEQIESDLLLTRVLNWRLHALSLSDDHQGSEYGEFTRDAIIKLKTWLNTTSTRKVLRLTGSVIDLIKELNDINSFENSSYHGIVFFRNRIDSTEEKQFRNSKPLFSRLLAYLPDPDNNPNVPIIQQVLRGGALGKKNRKMIEHQEDNDPINRLFIRLIQIRLWLQGTYSGKLDSEMGKFSLGGIQDLAESVNIEGEDPLVVPKSFVMKLGKDHWAINTRYFLSTQFRFIDNVQEVSKSISEELSDMVDSVSNDNEKKALIEEINRCIHEEQENQALKKQKKKSKNGKGFFRAVRRFFSRVGKGIRRGFNWLIKQIAKFFKLIKNGIKSLLREIKKAFQKIKLTILFAFGKRIIKTSGDGMSIATDFDFDFDSITNIKGELSVDAINDLRSKINHTFGVLSKSFDFLEKAVPIIVGLLTPPFGWIKAGIKLVKLILQEKFDLKMPGFIKVIPV